jgi:four helix bundle protein
MQDAEFTGRLVQFTVDVVLLSHSHARDFHLTPIFNQVIRSAGSIGANITEAHGASSRAAYGRYFNIALQSANETKYWLLVLKELRVSVAKCDELLSEVVQFIKILTASLKTLHSKS